MPSVPNWYLGRLKSVALSRGLAFDITAEQAEHSFAAQGGRCALSGLPLTFSPTAKGRSTGSLDRLDCRLGYIAGNVQWVHRDINMMRQSMTIEHFLFMCGAVATHRATDVAQVTSADASEFERQRRPESIGKAGPAPLGYERDREGGIVPNEDAETVRRIFTRRHAGVTLQAIADELNTDAVKTARGASGGRAPCGTSSTIRNIGVRSNTCSGSAAPRFTCSGKGSTDP